MPRLSDILKQPAPANIDVAIAAIARRDHIRIMPDGLTAANQLGLTNAVPAKASYVTDGATKTLKIDGRTIHLQHASPSVMCWAGKSAAPVAQALRWLGPRAAADAQVIDILNKCLPDTVRQYLIQHRRDLPGWAASIIRNLAPNQNTTA